MEDGDIGNFVMSSNIAEDVHSQRRKAGAKLVRGTIKTERASNTNAV